ncbi:MAG: hypothetical protein AMXMBFR4_19680 [Candidatus Hydrogenedentota bacterium]
MNDCLERIGRIEAEVDWLEDPALRLGYRTRAEFHGSGGALGFYALGTHRVVGITQCPLCHPRLNEALARLREAAVSGPVEVTVNPEGDDRLIWSAKPNRVLAERFPDAQGPRSTGARRQFLFDGVPVVCGAFSQASLLLNRQLRQCVHQYLAGTRTVLELYCGSGNLSLGLEADVVGIDHNRTAVAAARKQGRGDYRAGDESKFADAIREREWDAILLDPPRTGAKPIVKRLAECNAGRLVYVSCDPATLARDLNQLTDAGWKVARVTAVDMFPNTAHVEVVALMER